ILENDIGHCRKELVQKADYLFRFFFFGYRRKPANIGKKDRYLLVDAAKLERRWIIKKLFYNVFGHKPAVIGACNLFTRKAFMGFYRFDRDRRLGRDCTDKL